MATQQPDGPMEWPHLERFSDLPMFNTKAVVQQTGIPAPTLRAWERRYNLIAPERANNTYRLYSERDIALIRWLKERVDSGMSISKAIALFQHLKEEYQQNKGRSNGNQAGLRFGFEESLPGHVAEELPDALSSTLTYPVSDNTLPLAPSMNGSTLSDPVVGGSDQMIQLYPVQHNILASRDHLIEIFQNMDEKTAHVMMGSLLSLYSIEQVCVDLIAPTLWRIGQLWREGKLTVSVEHFASNFFRALLTSRFHVTPSPLHGPLVLVCCSPAEGHEPGALMLALFLRLRHIRVAYLGQSIETAGLLHTIRHLQPAMVCISLTMPEMIAELIKLGQHMHTLPPPQPHLVFGGQAFLHNMPLKMQIPGCYLEGDLREIANKICSLIAEQEHLQASN